MRDFHPLSRTRQVQRLFQHKKEGGTFTLERRRQGLQGPCAHQNLAGTAHPLQGSSCKPSLLPLMYIFV